CGLSATTEVRKVFSDTARTRALRKEKRSVGANRLALSITGSSTRARTWDLRINSLRPQRVKVIGPSLHHLASLGQMQRMVVRGGDRVALLMRQLKLDVRVREAHLVEHRRCNAAKTVPRHPVLEPHPL